MKGLVFVLTILCFSSKLHAQKLLKYKAEVYDAKAAKGYYFLFTYRIRKMDSVPPGQQMIIDGTGHTVYYRITDRASDFTVHKNGLMSYFSNGKFYLLNNLFAVVDSVECLNGVETDPHDFQILSNGHYLLIGLDSVRADLSNYHIFMRRNLPGSSNALLKSGVIQELDKGKNLVYQWSAKPYFKLEECDRFFLNDTSVVDITHFNSVDKNRKGEILLSARYTHELIKLSANREIIWRMGGVHNKFRFTNDSLKFLGQHDARFYKNSCITLFDNGYAQEPYRHNARAVKYKLDEKNMTAKTVWQYGHEPTIISEATGNAQWQTNGNVLLNYGRVSDSSPNITFEEVTEKKQKVIVLSFQDSVGSYRAFHYRKLPFKLPQPRVRKTKNAGVTRLTVVENYAEHLWSTGEISKSIEVKSPGKYYVYVPVGDKGYISSKLIEVK